MKISIVVINYNGLKFLSRLFKSIFSQTEKNIEVIMVDNASTDTSIEYVKKYFPKVKIVKTENKGYGHGCNIGAKNATGKFVLISNPDIYFPKNFVKKIFNYYQDIKQKNPNKKIGAVCCQQTQFNSKFNPQTSISATKLDIFGNPYAVSSHNPENISIIPDGACFFIDRLLILKAKGFNKNIFLYGEEVEFFWRLKIFGYENYLSPSIYFYHYGSGITGKISPQKVAYMVYGSFIASYTNYNSLSLILILPLYFIYFITILLFIAPLTKFNFDYSKEIFLLIPKFIKNIKPINKYRIYTQKHRQINDLSILKHFSIIPAVIKRKTFQQFSKH